ncbi:sufS subfamily cysteine desulfurase [Acetobacter aceti NRIC 0242]|uniref:cysteine desulfurase n=1 Tax=Acetobacter aceti NBRC 14818 TaxID=887700 RepID=A0AB33IGZ6_ACEAC|nr:cysteine desulfurase [Acetobacter aceti]TCS33015.1 SufS family cysteine desulfurase [Acetobacter aceti NBRC 14818]BCK76442.1 hypothetical protein EMQ_2048 [Acetobacter aceti NBRC 14818]GAN56184.1 cysteine desulfurase SufS [Acetobacter aceti NBRC 14818]GBO81907.1 sufS subfamily cysteine desulfurase [Acetobacter aceti NRIC 0242]
MTTPDIFEGEEESAVNALVSRAFRDVLREEKSVPETSPTGFATGNDASSFEPVWSHAPVSPETPSKLEGRLISSYGSASPYTGGTEWLTGAFRDPTSGYGGRPYFLEHLSSDVPGRFTAALSQGYDPVSARQDFPILNQRVNGHQLVWLDNAATTQKPLSVINAISSFYERDNSNIHRGAHTLAARATDAFEGAREKLRRFIGAKEAAEIVFLRGTTEAINLVAQSYGAANIGAGDRIVVSTIEHHANIVPWQLLARKTGAELKAAPVNDRGEIILEDFEKLLTSRTKIVSVTHVANALGTINPVEEIIALAHARGILVLVDAAQSSPHLPIDVTALDADFLVLSGHKIYGPTGIGILYGKRALLDAMPPWQGGGHMIRDVTFEHTEFQGLPEKFEAGTPDISGAVGLGAAVDYLQSLGLSAIAAHEHALLEYVTPQLAEIRGLRIIGQAARKASVVSFVIDGHTAGDVARHLDRQGIAARSGHHCAQPSLRRFGVEETVRASFGLYNTFEDVDVLVRALHQLPRS